MGKLEKQTLQTQEVFNIIADICQQDTLTLTIKEDKTLINKLWWLRRFLNNHFGEMEHKDVIHRDLNTETLEELEDIVDHINNLNS